MGTTMGLQQGENNREKKSSTYPPFAPGINDAVAEDQSTASTHEVSRAKLLDNGWIGVSAVRADETDREVRCEGSLLGFRR
jgi:hypothetical protein